MPQQDFNITIETDQTAQRVFDAVTNVKGWWSGEIEGSSLSEGDEFVYRYKDMHFSVQKVIDMVPGKRLTWLVTDSELSFMKNNPSEWTGTTISFDIAEENGTTRLKLTHHGLSAVCDCFDACSQGWTHYMDKSLLPLINTGKGLPG
jgi:hypothetical protein